MCQKEEHDVYGWRTREEDKEWYLACVRAFLERCEGAYPGAKAEHLVEEMKRSLLSTSRLSHGRRMWEWKSRC